MFEAMSLDGTFEPPIFITPRFSLQKFSPGGVTALRPSITGNSPFGPGTPRYEESPVEFQQALDTIDFGGTPSGRAAALSLVLRDAQAQDVVTLWHLLTRVALADRGSVFDRLASFVPPPLEVTRDGIISGRRDMLDAWWDALGLGTAAWWRTWKQPWRTDTGGTQ